MNHLPPRHRPPRVDSQSSLARAKAWFHAHHFAVMIALCLLPILALGLFYWQRWDTGGFFWLFLLLCPLVHLLTGHDDHASHVSTASSVSSNEKTRVNRQK